MNNKKEDEIYCSECGKTIKRNAVICIHCGVMQVKESVTKEKPTTEEIQSKSNKTKTSAIVLAVLFGFLAWLYTYKKNIVKFWSVVGISIFMSFIYYYLFVGDILFYIYAFGIWLWVLLDTIRKPNSFYENYPKG